MRAPVGPVGPYSTRVTLLYVLLIADATINATVEAEFERSTTLWTALTLGVQIVVRVACICTTVSILSASRAWRDDFLLDFCVLFAVSLIGLIMCLFLRVYRVTMATFPSRFPTVLDYWGSSEYWLLLVVHALLSLLFYYTSISAAHRMGSAKYFDSQQSEATVVSQAPSLYTAVHLASMRRR